MIDGKPPQDDEGVDALTRELRARLRGSEALDAVTRARLSAARARALDARLRPRLSWAPWGALGGAVAAGLVAIALLLRPDATPVPMHEGLPGDIAPGEFFELVLEDDPLTDAELVEDLDVLVWLAGGERA